MTIRAKSVRVAVLCAAATAVVPLSAAPAQTPQSCASNSPTPGTAPEPTMVAGTLAELNSERARLNLPQLRLNGKLSRVAHGHSQDMVTRGYFAHDAPGGPTWQSRIRSTGYLQRAQQSTIGENIAWGRDTCGSPHAIVQAWMNSPPHRHIMLLRRFTDVGIGIVPGTPSGANAASATYTADFGFKR
jgi:uncharacterized protein YkwD